MSNNQLQVQLKAPETVQKFTNLFAAVHKVDAKTAEDMHKVELFHFMNLMEDKQLEGKVTYASAAGVFLDVVSNGLSFSPQAKHVYVMSRSVKSGRKDESGKDVYEDRLYFQTQPDGKIYQAQKAGAIDYVTKPVIVYQGDVFEPCTNESGHQIIIHKPKIPRESTTIIAGYVYVVFRNGNREPTWLTYDEVTRLQGYSSVQNGRWDSSAKKRVPGNANPLYSSGPGGQIDIGFFGSKIINAALKNIRKTGKPSVNEVEGEIEEVQTLPGPSGTFIPSMVITPAGEVSETTENEF